MRVLNNLNCPAFSALPIKNEKIKVSVIMPVYNSAIYLKDALNSLKNQTLKEMEFICVNDGSTDNSLEILKKFARDDSRFKIINQKNQGTGKSRNNALKSAKGEYIAFMDSDDIMNRDTAEILYNQAEKQNCDLITFDYVIKNVNNNSSERISLKNNLKGVYDLSPNKNFNWRDVKQKILGGFFYASWNKFYKHDFLKKYKLHFTNCSMSEDNAFVFGSMLNACKMGYNDKAVYNYFMRPNSAVHKVSDKNFCIFKVCDSVMKTIEKSGHKEMIKDELDDYIADTMHYHYKRIKSKDKYLQKCREKFSPKQFEMIEEKLTAQDKVYGKIGEILEMLNKKHNCG